VMDYINGDDYLDNYVMNYHEDSFENCHMDHYYQ